MTNVEQVAADLRYVRGAVEGRRRMGRPSAWAAVYWAAYSLTGYVLVDLNPQAAQPFWVIGLVVGLALSGWAGARAARRDGVVDRSDGRRQMLFWAGGVAFIILAYNGLAVAVPDLHGMARSQVVVVMVGLLYYSAAAQGQPGMRHMLWAGPVVAAGGICVGLVPHHGWSALGAVFAACLLSPVFARLGPTRLAPASRPSVPA